MVRRLSSSAPGFAADFAALLSAKRESDARLGDTVRGILAEVRRRGDDALFEFAARFDGAAPSSLRLSDEEILAAEAECDPEALAALDLAAERITQYHRRQLPSDELYTDDVGARLGWRWTAIDSVGLYVPGGTASYPSSVLMNAMPARVAGVPRVVMVTPARDGRINPLTLAAARRAGIKEIYRIGGAQAVAALAYGTKTIAAVDKIVGPGNAYVAEAKRLVFGVVGIDSVAGPSEILIIADDANDPDWIAADLLSQAEHDASSQSVLITNSRAFADRVEAAVERALESLPRVAIAGASWRDFGAIIVVGDLKEAAALSNRIAPEHLELAVAAPDALLGDIRHAGAIFLGRHTPEAMGDYIAGPNHVLPTSRTARFSSGLSVLDFLKRSTLLSLSEAGMSALGPAAIKLAEAEGLDAHARSIAARLSER